MKAHKHPGSARDLSSRRGAALALLAAAALAGCRGAPVAEFAFDEDIDGQNPAAATLPIFGAAVFDGVGQIVLISSSATDLCEQIGENSVNFVRILLGRVPGVHVVVMARDTEGLPGRVARLESDGTRISVASAFAVGGEVGPVAAEGDLRAPVGVLELTRFVEGKTLSGTISDVLSRDTVGGGDIDVSLTGSFENAVHCQALTDRLASTNLSL
jgi:hypothetical protein